MKKEYYEKIIDEIVEMIKTNLYIYYNNNDDYLIYLRTYCKENSEYEDKDISYMQLLFFAEEALADLINCPYLYDYRCLE